ncbi:MAG: guanylate kinase [Bacteroidales bacterium]|nr:guanylate kinase [Bacteroidales bacterium]
MTQAGKGKCIIISAPSGAGKTTIVKKLLEADLGLEFSVSATSRALRPGEMKGRDYYFMSPSEFKRKIEEEFFLEWEEVYSDHFYGTLKSEVERIWNKGHHVIFDVDVYGGLNLKKYFGKSALAVFIMPPSIDALRERLLKRSTESEENLSRRLSKAEHELAFSHKFDLQIMNDELDRAVELAVRNVRDFLKKQ